MDDSSSSSSSWATGLAFSITASLIGACSKLCIRKSYTLLLLENSTSTTSKIRPETYYTTCDGDDDDDVEMKGTTTTKRNNSKALLKYSDTLETEEETSSSYVDDNDDNNDLMSETDDSTSDDFVVVDNNEQREEITTDNILTSYHHQIENNKDQNQQLQLQLQQPSGWFRKIQAFALRLLGMCGMMFLGPACNVYALQFASPSILSPVGGGLTLVWIILLSDCMINEKPKQSQVHAVQFIVVGEIFVAFAGDHSNEYSLSENELKEQYSDPAMIIYLSMMALWMILLTMVIRFSHNQNWKRFAWGIIGGSITGVQCFIKDALALLHGLDDNKDINSWPGSLYILLLIGAAIPFVGLVLLMACMKRYDVTFSSSMFMASIVVSSSLMSAIHYHTFDHIQTIWQSLLYILGLVCMLCGTSILTSEKAHICKTITKLMKTSSSLTTNNTKNEEQILMQEEDETMTTTSNRNLILHHHTDTTKLATNSSSYGTMG